MRKRGRFVRRGPVTAALVGIACLIAMMPTAVGAHALERRTLIARYIIHSEACGPNGCRTASDPVDVHVYFATGNRVFDFISSTTGTESLLNRAVPGRTPSDSVTWVIAGTTVELRSTSRTSTSTIFFDVRGNRCTVQERVASNFPQLRLSSRIELLECRIVNGRVAR